MGRLQAYYEIISLMLSQATAFGLSAEELALAGWSPNLDLLDGDA